MVPVINLDIILINSTMFLWLSNCVIVLFSRNSRVCHFAFPNYVYAIPIRKHFCPFSPSCSFLRYSYVHSLSMMAHKFKARVMYSNTIKLQVGYKCYIYLGVQKSKNYSILLLLKKSIISWSIGTFIDFLKKKVSSTYVNESFGFQDLR